MLRINSLLGCAVCAAMVCVSLVSASLGQAVVDDFDDNALNSTLWDYVVLDGAGALAETNQRLEYTSPGENNGAPGDENAAYYKLKTPAAYGSAWMLTLDVHVEDYNSSVPPSDYEYGMEIGIFNPADSGDRLWLGRYRGYDWHPAGIDNSWCVYKATDDSDVIDDFTQANGSDGTMKIVWDGASMSMYYREDGAFQVLMTGVGLSDWGMSSGDAFDILVGGQDTAHPTALDEGQNLYADNFELVPEPATLALLSFGGLAMVRRRRSA
ncbi:MAG: PEP-CTERM sorting domain-containing protein [Phycisphaerae bacterium]|nr:PEP-CTERM sorting domain-containing protein [Phycisphaerae bacterium]